MLYLLNQIFNKKNKKSIQNTINKTENISNKEQSEPINKIEKNKKDKDNNKKIKYNNKKNKDKNRLLKKENPSVIHKTRKETKKQKKIQKKEFKKIKYGPLYQICFTFFLLYIVILLSINIFQKPLYLKGQFIQYDDMYAIFIPSLTSINITENKNLQNVEINQMIYIEYNNKNKIWNYNTKNNLFKRNKLKAKVINKNDYYITIEVNNIQKIDLEKLKIYKIPLNYEVEVPIKKYFGKYQIFLNFNTLVDKIVSEYNK